MAITLAERLVELRTKSGISQLQAAKELGISQSLLSHYETGARKPKLDFIARATKYYGVNADFLLGLGSTTANESETVPLFSGKIEAALDYLRYILADNAESRQYAEDVLCCAAYRLIALTEGFSESDRLLLASRESEAEAHYSALPRSKARAAPPKPLTEDLVSRLQFGRFEGETNGTG